MTDPRVLAARAGTNPAAICELRSGWVFLCDQQFLRGYCILRADPDMPSINDLDERRRAQFLLDMVLVGDAVGEVTGAYRINYFIGGNSDPILHAHIVPRYWTEPEKLRKDVPWSYPERNDPATFFDPQRDESLIQELRVAIQKRLDRK